MTEMKETAYTKTKNRIPSVMNCETLFLVVLTSICFFLHIKGIRSLYSPFLYGEEMGYWTNAATLAGYDWSPVIIKSGNPWYSYGYSLILVPLFYLFDDMVSMYRAAIVMNALFATFSFWICYRIALRFGKGINRLWLLLAAFCVSIYSSFLHQSSIAVTETFLYFVIWVVFYLFIRYEEKPGPLRGIALSCSVCYAYCVHNRTIGILIAYLIMCIVMLFSKKIRLRDLAALLVPILVFFAINTNVVEYLSARIWNSANASSSDYSKNTGKLIASFSSIRAFLGLLASVICKYWYACAASFMLCFWGFYYGVRKVTAAVRKKDAGEYVFSTAFFLLSYMGVFAIAANSMKYTEITEGRHYRQDMMVYGRYAECAVGILLLLGFIELFHITMERRRSQLITGILTYGLFLVSAAVEYRYYTAIENNASSITGIETQVNSTPGLFYYGLLGYFSIKRITFLAIAVSALVFVVFCVFRRNGRLQQLARAGAIGLLALFFVYASDKSFQCYTYVNQEKNNRTTFNEVVEMIEDSYSGAAILVDSEDLYSYFDFQNRIIHSTIYPESVETVEDWETYDLLIVHRDNADAVPEEQFSVLMENDAWVVFAAEQADLQDN